MASAPVDAYETMYPGGVMRSRHHFFISIYWLATNLFWAGLLVIGVPHHSDILMPQDPAWAEAFLIAVGAIPALIVPIIAGQLSDRCMSRLGRRRPYMLAGVVVNLLGMAVLWVAVRHVLLWLYAVAYIVCNIGNNIAGGPYAGLIPDRVPRAQRGVASGWMGAMTQVGNIIGLLGVALLLGHDQEGPALLVMGGVFAVCLGLTLFGIREIPRTEPPEPLSWKDSIRRVWIDPRQYPDFAWVWITRLLVTMGIYAVQPYLRLYLNDVIGVPRDQCDVTVGLVFGCLLGCATVTGLLGGSISDRIGRKRVVYLANSIIAAACLAFPFGHNMTYVYFVASAFGIGYGAYYSVDWALGVDVLPNPDDAAKDLAVWQIAMVLPQTLTPPLASCILRAFHSTSETVKGRMVTHYSPTGYLIVFVLAAFFLLLGAVMLRNVKKVR
jgi:MFS family permease